MRADRALVVTQFQALPNKAAIFYGVSSLLVTLGHVALINLLFKNRFGRALLAPLKAVGRTTFTLYLMQNFLGMWVLFPGFALGLWGRYSYFGLTLIALTILAVQIIMANVWLCYFTMGPLEWLWRSLTYKRLQPFRYPVANRI